jgi:hypothetical protein
VWGFPADAQSSSKIGVIKNVKSLEVGCTPMAEVADKMNNTIKLPALTLLMGFQALTVLAETAAPGSKEDIYVVRSLLIARETPTNFCSQVGPGFGKLQSENHYLFKSIAVQTTDGRVANTNVRTVGKFHACIGETGDPKVMNVFAQGSLGSVTFTGRGECSTDRQDFPETGIDTSRCYLNLGGLPDRFVGGKLTTNSIGSRRLIGAISEPTGYTQPSIATFRLWRKNAWD